MLWFRIFNKSQGYRLEGDGLIKIKVSYEHPEELEKLKRCLGQNVKRIKEPKKQEGKFRKVYIELLENTT